MAITKGNDKILIDNVIDNTSANLIKITEDRLNVILLKNVPKLRKPQEIINPVALLLSLLAAIVTADFKEVLGLTAESWKAIFVVAFIISIFYLLYCLYNLIFNRSSIDSILKEIKTKRNGEY